MSDLSPRDQEIYHFIRTKIEDHGFPPTIRDIGSRFEIKSPNGVMNHLKALEKKGLIKRISLAPRAVSLVRDDIDCAGQRTYSRQNQRLIRQLYNKERELQQERAMRKDVELQLQEKEEQLEQLLSDNSRLSMRLETLEQLPICSCGSLTIDHWCRSCGRQVFHPIT